MPKAETERATKHKEPHERESGPWDDWELSDAARHLDHADKISGNKKFLEAIKKHAESKAEEHRRVARHASHLAKSGRISEKQMDRVKQRHG